MAASNNLSTIVTVPIVKRNNFENKYIDNDDEKYLLITFL